MDTTTSADGSTMAYESFGEGPVVILIGGAFNDRTTVTGRLALTSRARMARAQNAAE